MTYSFFKRQIDVLLAILLLFFIAPICLFFALLIFLSDQKSPFFLQKRLGKNCKSFTIFKLRSMTYNKDSFSQVSTTALQSVNDHRITPLGRFIRRTSIDELPQVLNIILGDMSFIGPRPILPDQLISINSSFYDRFKVPPGLSGLAQVSGRKHIDWLKVLELDCSYVTNLSFKNDFFILCKTFIVVFHSSQSHVSPNANVLGWRDYINADH